MPDHDPLAELESLVRGRIRLAIQDKALFERDDQRLNTQLMQGEINMGTAVLGWIERIGEGASPPADDDTGDSDDAL